MKLGMGPEPDQLEELMSGPADTPVVMVNLLRFKERAGAPGEDISGAESYQRYAERMRKIVEGVGGRFIWSGRVDSQVIGRSDVPFDMVGPGRVPLARGVPQARLQSGGPRDRRASRSRPGRAVAARDHSRLLCGMLRPRPGGPP